MTRYFVVWCVVYDVCAVMCLLCCVHGACVCCELCVLHGLCVFEWCVV